MPMCDGYRYTPAFRMSKHYLVSAWGEDSASFYDSISRIGFLSVAFCVLMEQN